MLDPGILGCSAPGWTSAAPNRMDVGCDREALAADAAPPVPGVLCAAMAAQFAVGGSVIPFITLWFGDRGLGLREISLIFTASSATLLVFPFLWGMLADRYIPLNRLFIVLNVLAGSALAFLVTQQTFPGLLIGFTCYFACFNPTLYLMNALGFHHLPDPKAQFGRLRAWGSLGWVVPFLPISLWLVREPKADLRFVFYVGIVCCVAMAAVGFFLPHTAPGGRSQRGLSAPGTGAVLKPLAGRGEAYGRALRRLLTDPNYLVLLVSMFLMAGSFSLLTFYSPPRLQEAGVTRPWIGPVHAIGVLFEIVLFQWQPSLLRRWNYTGVILAGCAALVLRQLLFALSDNAWVLALSYLLAGVVIVFYNQGVSILVNALAAKEVRATAQTLLLFFGQGTGPLLANAMAGRLALHAENSLTTTFFFAAGLATIAGAVVAWRGRKLDRSGG